MSEREFLGRLTVSIYLQDGNVVVTEHQAEASVLINEMQLALNQQEQRLLTEMRRKAVCQAANYFLAMHNPDAPLHVEA